MRKLETFFFYFILNRLFTLKLLKETIMMKEEKLSIE
jgi:hypothetical protein